MKDYAAIAYDQPYQRALYSGGQLLEARKWHVDEYVAVIGTLTAPDLEVRELPSQLPLYNKLLPGWLEARKWHVDEYVAVIGTVTASDLEVRHFLSQLRLYIKLQPGAAGTQVSCGRVCGGRWYAHRCCAAAPFDCRI